MKLNKKDQQCLDMNELLRTKIFTLAEDMAWRCQEAGLSPYDFHTIMGINCMWAAAKAFAASTKSAADKEFVKVFRVALKKARKK